MKTLLLPASLATLTYSAQLLGQSTTNTPPATTKPTESLDRIVVEGIPLEEQVVPTVRPFNSVYGSDRPILDTPRNVTIISREQLDAINIYDVRDFSKLTSSSYTRSNFGAPTTPDIRTQIADTYVNGMRLGLTSNGNGLPVNFNSVESVNIVKGPASSVYGPSQYVGGYVDLITKRPYFDDFHGEVSGTAGMYDQWRWTADAGGPLPGKKAAWRASYSGENSGSYYYDGFRKSEAIYGALSWVPTEQYELFFNTEWFWANYTENFGVNRPTQQLIDDGLYQTGVNNNPAPDFGTYPLGFADANGNPITFGNVNVVGGTPATPSDPQNSRYVVSGFPAINRIDPGPLVKLDRRTRLLRPGDDSEGFSYNAQAVQTYHASSTVDIANNTMFRYVDRQTLSSYYYSEIIDPSWSMENRTEFRLDLDKHFINTGADFRYQSVTAYNDFFTEPANVWDLTRDRNFINIYNSVNFPNPFTSVPVPGHEGRYYTPDNGDSGESTALFVGPFYQHDFKVTDKWSLLAGGRVNLVSLDYNDPAGFLPGDSTVVGLPSANASTIYKFTPTVSGYFTYNWSQNPVGSVGNGGGYTTAGTSNFSNRNLRNEAELFELGSKYSLFEGKLFLGAAVFQQTRADAQLDRSVVEFETRGIEFEANYQPTREFYMTIGYSFLDSTVNQPQFDVGNTSLTSPSDRFFSLSGDEFKRQGVPDHLLNFLATYKLYKGLGVSANIVFTSEINNNVAGTLVIPAQYTLDMSIFYATPRWEARLMFLNVTDQKNWSAPNAVYGNESIVADLPFRMEGRMTVKF
jgi:outer membrane receptor for monomeric catechols